MEGFDAIVDAIFEGKRGYAIGCGVVLLLMIFGGITAVLTPIIGDYAPLIGLATVVLLTLIFIGIMKNNIIAKIIGGILLIIIGLGISIFIIYDFIQSIIKGQSLLSKGTWSTTYGVWVFIILATGLTMVGGGLMLMGVIKQQ